MILGKVVSQALKANQLEMGKELSHQVSTQVVKEMDYLFRLQEEREETHYKKILMRQLRATQQKAQKNFFKKKEKKPKEKKSPKDKRRKTVRIQATLVFWYTSSTTARLIQHDKTDRGQPVANRFRCPAWIVL